MPAGAESWEDRPVGPGQFRPDRASPDRASAVLGGVDVASELLFEASPQAMWIHDRATLRFLAANRAVAALYGYPQETFLGLAVPDLAPPARHDGASPWDEHVPDLPARSGLRHHLRADGTVLTVEVATDDMRLDGRPACLVVVRDVTRDRTSGDPRRNGDGPPDAAMTDPLTGLANRVVFLDRLDKALDHSRVEGHGHVGVLFIDVDRFKSVNDTLGHAAGDKVLVTLAERLRRAVPRTDTVARFGGDEFTVLCESLPDTSAGHAVAQRILKALGSPVTIEGAEWDMSVSIGVAVAGDDDHVSAEFLLHGADWAMYRAKQNGRRRFEVFDQDSRARSMARLQRADDLRRGVQASELRTHYQPIVRLHGSGSLDVEVLLRWDHPQEGLLPPKEFIEVAEETGLIVPMGAWVIEQACQEIAALDPVGAEPIGLSVNLSVRQLARGELLDVVRGALRSTGMDPERLCLEITETALMEDLEWSVEALLGLKTLGVRLAIDDFGTGYSSLNYLRRLPVDVVKIDRSFVAGLGVEAVSDAIVAAIVNLSHALGLTVVAEGVEREEQLVALRALGCDRAQGFFWSRPVPLADLEGALTTWARGVERTDVDVRAILVDRASALRAASGRRVLLRGPDRLPSAIGDPGAVRTVLDHLLGNSVAFSTADRPIEVAATADRRLVRVSVSDYGQGMTPAEVARCFEPFWQAGASPDGRPGTGIGLYIVRSLVEKMGGRVWVRSSPGKGSTFTFALPRSSARPGVNGAERSWDRGEQTVIQEFMRQLGVPSRREP